jgi:hypothetical protein
LRHIALHISQGEWGKKKDQNALLLQHRHKHTVELVHSSISLGFDLEQGKKFAEPDEQEKKFAEPDVKQFLVQNVNQS